MPIKPLLPRNLKALAARIVSSVLVMSCLMHAAHADGPNNIDYAMYFLSEVRDNEHCAMKVANGQFVIPSTISNPAMTCPDMTSWRLFATVVQDRFWQDWPDERQNWPSEPWPLCQPDKPAQNCCSLNSRQGNSKEHCPFYPGDHHTNLLQGSASQQTEQPPRVGRPSITHQLQAASTQADAEEIINSVKSLNLLAEQAAATPNCSPAVINELIPKNYESIGRVIRQTNAEITVRNRSFHNYLFENNLYNREGVADIFNRNFTNQQKNAPFAAQNRSARGSTAPSLAKIDFPADAIMIKSNWLHSDIAKKLGIENKPDAPFITQQMVTSVSYTKGNQDISCNIPGIHYLVAFHVSSKDIPNWVWATFEHVAVPGRCDVTGCNDSYGYNSPYPQPEGTARNYVRPHTQNDQLMAASATVFKRDQLYDKETINPGLDQVFTNLGIGTRRSANIRQPDKADLGWRYYRLKGSQVEFTNSMGRKTFLGNSITEAGFMNGSSCITCHARAGFHPEQSNKNPFLRLSVFTHNLSDFGYGLSAHGIPDPAWFHTDNNAGSLDVLQTDFVWGFLFAQPLP